jgi:hypothetical protein
MPESDFAQSAILKTEPTFAAVNVPQPGFIGAYA